MNISAISMVNKMPSFSGQKQILHRNSDEDCWIETVQEPKDEVVIHRNSDEDWFVTKKTAPKHNVKTGNVKKHPRYELGPDGKTLGVWTRNGGDDVFFTPAKDIKIKEIHAPKNAESKQEYYARKLYSPEWIG